MNSKRIRRLLLGGQKEVVSKCPSFMSGIENLMTQGDPDKGGGQYLSGSQHFHSRLLTVFGFYSYTENIEGKYVMNKHYGSPGAGKPLAGWERAITSV